jgi:hypothetical protein
MLGSVGGYVSVLSVIVRADMPHESDHITDRPSADETSTRSGYERGGGQNRKTIAVDDLRFRTQPFKGVRVVGQHRPERRKLSVSGPHLRPCRWKNERTCCADVSRRSSIWSSDSREDRTIAISIAVRA